MRKTLAEMQAQIMAERPFVDVKPFSHNTIGLTLMAIAEQFGNEEADETITRYGLDELGWERSDAR